MKAIAKCPKCGDNLITECEDCIKNEISVHVCKGKDKLNTSGVKWKIIDYT
jgi:hypothetical protein